MATPKSCWFLGMVGVLCLASGCNRTTASNSSSVAQAPTQPTVEQPVAEQPSAVPLAKPLGTADFFPNPLVAGGVQPSSMPNLIPPTTTAERMPQISTGRPDPFASLGLTPTVTVKPAASAAPPPASVPTTSVVASAAPPPLLFPAPAPLPNLLPAPANLPPLSSLPTVAVPNTAPQKSLAEAINISGVVEVAGKTNVILQVPNEQTSRYAAVGERLGNGKVLIKRVEMGLEPVVILEQEGREIARSVGSGAMVGTL